MRILAITDVYFPRRSDVSVALRTLAAELRAKGHGITLIAPDYPAAVDVPGEDLVRVSSRALGPGRQDRAMKVHRVLELTDRLRAWNYDVIHVHTPYIAHLMGVVLARRLQLPVVETWNVFHDERLMRYAPQLRASWRQAIASVLSRVQCRGVDALIAHSTATRDRLRVYGVEKPIAVIPPGVETHLLRAGDGSGFRAIHRIDSARPVLLHVAGRGESAAGFLLAVLAEVCRQVPNVLLLVAGVESARPYWQARADALGLTRHLAFAPLLDAGQGLLDCYNAADCFVFDGREDPQETALLEAMSAGLPLVGIACARLQDILTPESPAIVVPPQVSEFVAQVFKVLREPAWRSELAGAGRRYAQRWSASVTVEQVLDCYQEAITLHGRPVRALAH